MQGSGWTKVLPKRPIYRWDVFPFGGSPLCSDSAKVTSFYVSEFPDYYNAKGLFELFGCSGKVVEVGISPRRTRLGKRFAFARFLDVTDGRLLAICLDNILIEGKKLHVNLPRFQRSKAVGASRTGNSLPMNSKKHAISNMGLNHGHISGGSRGNYSSYADVVGRKGLGREILKEDKEDNVRLNFQSKQELSSRFERAFVGHVCIPGSAYKLQTYLEMEGIFTIKVTPIGGNCCLLEDKEDGFIEELIKEGETWWKSLFNSIEKWEAGKVDGRRDVWLSIYGVPLHVWGSDFFISLGNSWGRFICTDDNTAKGEVFDIARIMINISIYMSIPDVVSVCIDGSVFKLSIREDSQGLYRVAGGNPRVASSEDSSSEQDSDRFVVSESGNSMENDDVDAVCFGNKVSQDKVPAENICVPQPVDRLKKGSSSENREFSGIGSKVPCGTSAASNCRHVFSADVPAVNIKCRGKTVPEVEIGALSNSRGRMDILGPEITHTKSISGDTNSATKAFSCPDINYENCSEVPSDGFVKDLISFPVEVRKKACSLCELSVCRPISVGTAASDFITANRSTRRGRKKNFRPMILRTHFGSSFKDRSADSIESFESVSCHRFTNSPSKGVAEIKDPATGAIASDSVNETNGICELVREDNSSIIRNSSEAFPVEHTAEIPVYGGGHDLAFTHGNLSLLSESHYVQSGDIHRNIMQEHSVNDVGDRVEGKK